VNLDIPLIAVQFVCLLMALTVHESAHALSANWFGDPTAKNLGRISLNPLAHIDPIGTVLFPIIAMISGIPLLGWAKPTPVNPHNLRKPKSMSLWISAAGPLSNIGLGFVMLVLLGIGTRAGLLHPGQSPDGLAGENWGGFGFQLLGIGVILNASLAVFNLIPVPPLDGGGILAGLLPGRMEAAFENLGRYGTLVLYAMMLIPIGDRTALGWLFTPVGPLVNVAIRLAIGY
jgi:Zn-dependent protease